MVAEQPINPTKLQAELDSLLTEYNTWRMASPFALLFFFGQRLSMVFKAIFQQITNLVSIVGVTSIAVVRTGLTWYQGIFIVVALILIFVTILAVLAYRRFRFRITHESIAVKSGILRITQTDVRWERIRAVNLERGPIERVCGLAQISLDTAGSAEAEVQVPAIKLQLAELLRAKVSLETADSNTIGEEVAKHGKTIYRMNLVELLRASVCTQGTLAMVFAVLGSFVWIAATLRNLLVSESNGDDDAFWIEVFTTVRDYYVLVANTVESFTGIPATQSWIGMTIPAILLVLMLLSLMFIGRALYFCASNYDLQLLRRDDALSTVRGLLTKKRTNVKLERVQSVSLKMNVREIFLNLGRLTAMQSMSGKEHMLSLPSVPASTKDEIVTLTAREADSKLKLDPKAQKFLPISIVYFWKLFLAPTAIPFAAVSITSVFLDYEWFNWVWIAFLAGWIPICISVAMVRWRRAGYVVDSTAMISRSGLLGYLLEMGKFKKVHRVRIEQSFIQRFTGKSTLIVHFATTEIVIPFLPRIRAVQLHDYILHVIAVRHPEWQ